MADHFLSLGFRGLDAHKQLLVRLECSCAEVLDARMAIDGTKTSGPLSERMWPETPRRMKRSDRTSITSIKADPSQHESGKIQE